MLGNSGTQVVVLTFSNRLFRSWRRFTSFSKSALFAMRCAKSPSRCVMVWKGFVMVSNNASCSHFRPGFALKHDKTYKTTSYKQAIFFPTCRSGTPQEIPVPRLMNRVLTIFKLFNSAFFFIRQMCCLDNSGSPTAFSVSSKSWIGVIFASSDTLSWGRNCKQSTTSYQCQRYKFNDSRELLRYMCIMHA